MGLRWLGHCLSDLNMPKCTILKRKEKSKSKSELPRVTIRGQINPSTRVSEVAQKKDKYMSSNGPPGNCCKVLNKHLTGHVLK